jgi:SRSO17 transposase
MTNSTWSNETVFQQIYTDLKSKEHITKDAVLILDESADEKASNNSAGSAKQYNGRMGKIETSQVGVFLCYANMNLPQGFWTWINGKLYLPECWFETNEDNKKKINKLKIPSDLKFKTKIELAWDMIEDAIKNGLPFKVISFDTLYGRNEWLRKKIRDAGHIYMAEVPVNTNVYLEKPELSILETHRCSGFFMPYFQSIVSLYALKKFRHWFTPILTS